jgi:hypothetical protein
MRRATLLGLWIAVPVLVLAAEGVAETLWAKEAFEKACYQFVSSSFLPIPAVPAPLKALAATQRKAAVEALGARAKAYYASEAFKRSWVQGHGGHYDDAEAVKRQAQTDEQMKKIQAQQDQAMANMERMLPMMPPEAQAQMRAALAQNKAQKAQQATGGAKASAGAAVPDAKAALRQALQRFLKASEGVDFEAPLKHGEYRSTFANAEQEAKPEAWKACYRAGRQATEAARAYAKAWLAELG